MSAAALSESLLEDAGSGEPIEAACLLQSICLRLIAGSQKGANLVIPLDTPISIGGDISCDVVLRDAADDQMMTVQIDTDGVLLAVQRGSISVGNQTVESGMQQRIKLNETVSLGGCEFTFTARSEIGEPVPATEHLRAASESIQVEAVDDSGISAQTTIPGQRLLDRNWMPIVIGAVLFSSLLTIGILIWQKMNDFSTANPQTSVGELLRYSEFSDLEVATENGLKVVKGFVSGRDDAIRLRTLLAQANTPVINKVQIGDELAGQVQNVYRVNGVDAEVRAIAAGEVEVSTQNVDEQLLEKLENIVKRDVPQIVTINNVNIYTTVVADATPEPKHEALVSPGDRVKMVVSSDPPHVVLGNDINYYIGSLMPNGHRIVSIVHGLVTLEKDGVRNSIQYGSQHLQQGETK